MNGRFRLSRKTATSLQIAAIVIATFAVFGNVLFNGFVLDDSFQIIGNRWIKDIRNLPDIFSSSFVLGGITAFYRPLIHVSYMISYYLFGLAPWGFHLMSILLHTGVSILVFLTLAHLLRVSEMPVIQPTFPAERRENVQWLPFGGAMLFATHPIHTEAVAWISVTDLHMTFFYLLSFYLYARSSESGKIWGVTFLFSVVSFFLATLCKEPALTLPAILATYDFVFWKKGRGISYYIKRYIPYLVASGIYFALRLNALGGMVGIKTTLKLSTPEYLIGILTLFNKYMAKLLLPVYLNVWHTFRLPETLFSLSGMISILVAAAFIAAAVLFTRKRRVALLGMMFILLPLVPALYLPGLTQGLENAFTERYLYLPSFGFILLLILLVRRLLWKRSQAWHIGFAVALAITVLLYSYGSITRNRVWKDHYTLWSDTVQKSPDSTQPHNGLGNVLREQGRYEEAIQQYKAALIADPNNPFSRAYLGLAYANTGRPDMAIKELQTALQLKPDYAEAFDYLGTVYGTLGRHAKAIEAFEAALRLNPELDFVYNHLGSAYSNLGMTEKALENYQKAIRLNPENAEANNNLGILYAKMGKADEAIAHFHKALKLDPDNAGYHYNIANAYMMKGLTAKAEEHRRQAKSLQPGGIPH